MKMSENIAQKMKIWGQNFVIIIVIIRKYLRDEGNHNIMTYRAICVVMLKINVVVVKFR